jgi:chondroitin AC lyase
MDEPIVKKEVFSLWIDHGVKPQNGGYKYIVVPGIDASGVETYNNASKINILSNTSEIQAVQHTGLNVTEIVFYKAGSLKISDECEITAESPCIVLLKTPAGRISEIAVSDPTQKLQSLQLSVNTLIEGKGDHWQIEPDKEKKSSIIKVDLPQGGYAGKSVVIKL